MVSNSHLLSNQDSNSQPARQKWEYVTFLRARGSEKFHTSEAGRATAWSGDVGPGLEVLGEEGWELVAVTERSGFAGHDFAGLTTEELWVFKRPKVNK